MIGRFKEPLSLAANIAAVLGVVAAGLYWMFELAQQVKTLESKIVALQVTTAQETRRQASRESEISVSVTELQNRQKKFDETIKRIAMPTTAVIAFQDRCPEGWTFVKETVGSAIVGADVNPIDIVQPLAMSDKGAGQDPAKSFGDPGYTDYSGHRGSFDAGYLVIAPEKKSVDRLLSQQAIVETKKDYSQPSTYVPRIITTVTPTYLPFYYCKLNNPDDQAAK